MSADHPHAIAYMRTADAFRSGDLELLARLIADDVVWHVPGDRSMAGEIRGRDDLLAWLAALGEKGFWVPVVQVEEVLDAGLDLTAFDLDHDAAHRVELLAVAFADVAVQADDPAFGDWPVPASGIKRARENSMRRERVTELVGG